MSTHDRFIEGFATLPGYLSETSAAILDALLTLQTDVGISGSLLEIGVLHGKSAGLFALHTRGDESLVLIDPTEQVHKAAAVIQENAGISAEVLQCHSQSDQVRTWSKDRGKQFRWIHIDGDHTTDGFLQDLELSEQLLSEDGIICIDDFFSPWYPQITLATCDFLSGHREDLTVFLCGWNKGYLCRPEHAAQTILPFVSGSLPESLEKRSIHKFTLFMTDVPGNFDCFGIGPIIPSYRRRGPDSAPDHFPFSP
ncbi:MAG: class I SAM-dependent methyltransferase [Verrucomicrobiota bacterium]